MIRIPIAVLVNKEGFPFQKARRSCGKHFNKGMASTWDPIINETKKTLKPGGENHSGYAQRGQ